ncbi:hypothetical protein Trydic_g16415 [Trypoxylus dichotomus]
MRSGIIGTDAIGMSIRGMPVQVGLSISQVGMRVDMYLLKSRIAIIDEVVDIVDFVEQHLFMCSQKYKIIYN